MLHRLATPTLHGRPSKAAIPLPAPNRIMRRLKRMSAVGANLPGGLWPHDRKLEVAPQVGGNRSGSL